MRKHRILYLMILFVAVIVYIASDSGEALVLLEFLMLTPLVTFLIQKAAMNRTNISCRIKGSCRVNQTVPVVLTVERKSRLPMGMIRVDLTFENLLFQEKEQKELRLQPGEDSEMIFEYLYEARDCGAVKLHATNAYFYDLLGIFRWKQAIDRVEELQVYPVELQLQAEFVRRPEAKDFGDVYDPNKKGHDVSEVSGLREYAFGDALSSIHWKLSSKLDHLIVREFGSPSDYNTLVLYEMAKRHKEEPISHACCNAVLAITSALSHSMMVQGLEHNVGRVYLQDLQTMPVDTQSNHEQMLQSLLYMPIQDETDENDAAYVFMKKSAENTYTKIIYITTSYDEGPMKRIAETANLMVIHVTEGDRIEYTSRPGYAFMAIGAAAYQQELHTIML